MPKLEDIVTKEEKDLLPTEKTELRKNVRNLTSTQRKKFAVILAQSDQNMGEDIIPSASNTPENE